MEKLLTEHDIHEYDQYTDQELTQEQTERKAAIIYHQSQVEELLGDPEATVYDLSLEQAKLKQAEILLQKILEVIAWRTIHPRVS